MADVLPNHHLPSLDAAQKLPMISSLTASASKHAAPAQYANRAVGKTNGQETANSERTNSMKSNYSAYSTAQESHSSNERTTPTKELQSLHTPDFQHAQLSENQHNDTPAQEQRLEEEAHVDPQAQQPVPRTNTFPSLADKKRIRTGNMASARAETSGEDTSIPPEAIRGGQNEGPAKEKKKGVSFLSRFIGNKKKIVTDEGNNDNEFEQEDSRPEGMDAQLFSHSADNIGFSVKHPQPPAYIKVRARYKKEKEFDRLFLAQELSIGEGNTVPKENTALNGTATTAGGSNAAADGNAVWALEFSRDGKYLATGSQDGLLRIWQVISSPEERRAHEKEEEHAQGPATLTEHLDAPVFQKVALREFEGHSSAIIDISWSKNNFILSSSYDKTVRLWHVSRAECLCTFKHAEHVLSVQFHPRDDRFFLAGSKDAKLRLWSIPDKSVAFWNQLPDIITAVSFTPDGKTTIAGTLGGLCHFYETEGLKYQTQIHVRSAHRKNAKGSKITGIQAINIIPEKETGQVKLLISSNDSRIRLYNLRDKSLELKFKGYKNEETQIRAAFSDDARHIVCGSEDRSAYIWSTGPAEVEKSNQRPLELFEAHKSKAIWAVLAPTKTRQLLSHSEDPIYDLCNPPPVTLVSRTDSISSSRPPTESGNGSVLNTPAAVEGGGTFKRAEESPAYVARSAHVGGQIVVTADIAGNIRVFRQDCAYMKRLRSMTESWETGSVISKRVPSISMRSIAMGGLKRTGSVASRTTRGSRADSVGTQPPQDRILSWRQMISTPNQSSGSLDKEALRNGSFASARRTGRSSSPRKSVSALSTGSSSSHSRTRSRHHELAMTPIERATEKFPSFSSGNSDTLLAQTKKQGKRTNTFPTAKPSPAVSVSAATGHNTVLKSNEPRSPAPSSTERGDKLSNSPAWLQGVTAQARQFWDKSQYPIGNGTLQPPTALSKKASVVSALSDEVDSGKVSEESEDEKEASSGNGEAKKDASKRGFMGTWGR